MYVKRNLCEEDDIFLCGRCKIQFTSLVEFTVHKRFHLKKDKGTISTKCGIRPSIANNIDYEHDTSIDKQSKFSSRVVLTPALTPDIQMSVIEAEVLNNVQDKSQIKHCCAFCRKEFTKNFDLQQHMRSHTGEKPFQCVICGRAFAQKSNAKKHMATHRVWPEKFSCDNNNSSTVNQSSGITLLSNNKEWKKDVLTKFHHCNFCGESFPSYLKLSSHMKRHKDHKVYICLHKDCKKTFEELENFLTHVKVHDHQLEYSCHSCYEVFNSLSSLGCHQLEHSADIKKDRLHRYSQCPKCSMKFSSLESLAQHLDMSSHHYPCDRCPKICKSEKMLKLHVKIHDLKPYQCNICFKILKGANSLKVHQVTHSTSRPYQCEVCLLTFNRSDRLKRHKLIHQDKKIICPLNKIFDCNKVFKRNDKLRLHLNTHIKQFNIVKTKKSLKRKNTPRYNKTSNKDIHETVNSMILCQNGSKLEANSSVQNHVLLTMQLEGSEISRVLLNEKKNSENGESIKIGTKNLATADESNCIIYQTATTSSNEITSLDMSDPDYIISYDALEEDTAVESSKEVEVLYFPFLSTNILEPTIETVGSSNDLQCVLEINDQSYAYLESEIQTISKSETLFEETDLLRAMDS